MAPIPEIDLLPEERVVHLHQYGFIKVFRVVHLEGDAEHWATDILGASEPDRKSFKDLGWNIEEYHRGIKQCCGIGRCEGQKKKLSNEVTFFFHYWLFFDVKLNGCIRVSAGRVETLDSQNGTFPLYLATDFLI